MSDSRSWYVFIPPFSPFFGYTKIEIDEQARVIPLVMDELQDAFEAAIPNCDGKHHA